MWPSQKQLEAFNLKYGKRDQDHTMFILDASHESQTHNYHTSLDGKHVKTSCMEILACSKNPLATTAVMPNGISEPAAGMTNFGRLDKKFMTSHGFNADYWTKDKTVIQKMINVYENTYNAPLPRICVNNLRRGDYSKYNSQLNIADRIDDKIVDGHPFLLISSDNGTDTIAFKYSTWWDGALLVRTPLLFAAKTLKLQAKSGGFPLQKRALKLIHTNNSLVHVTTMADAEQQGIQYVVDVKAWVDSNKERITKMCGTAFDLKPNTEFYDELLQTAEYVYSERSGTDENILIMKTDPTIRGEKIPDTLYVELICSKMRGSSRALVGPGGIADALAVCLNKRQVLMSTLFQPSTLYEKYQYRYVRFENI